MRNLLITAIKESKLGLDEKKKNYEILMITKNLKKSLRKKTQKFSKVVLITEKILSRKSEVYVTIKLFLKNQNSSFIEIGYEKSKVSVNKAISNALINGSGKTDQTSPRKINEHEACLKQYHTIKI